MKCSLGLYEKSMPNSLTLLEKLKLCAEAGFNFLEISIDETEEKLSRLDWTESDFVRLDEYMRISGAPVRTMCLSGHRKYPLGSRDPATEARGCEIMRKAVDFAARTGIRIIQLAGYDVYYEQGGVDTREKFYMNLATAAEYAASKGVLLGFETMETPFMNTVKKAMDAVKRIDSPYLNVYPDIGNVRNGAGADYLADIESGRGRIIAAHLKETVEGVFRDMRFGDGRVDFDGCIELLKGMGVAMFTAEFWYDGKSDPLEYIKSAREFFREKI